MSDFKTLSIVSLFIIQLAAYQGVLGGQSSPLLSNIRWWEIHKYFMSISQNGLYTRSLQEKLDQEFRWTSEEVDLMQLLTKRQHNLDENFKQKIQWLKKLRDSIIDNIKDFKKSVPENHCCDFLKESEEPGIDKGCFHGKDLKESLVANPPPMVQKTMLDIRSVYSNDELLYFAFFDGGMYVYPMPTGYGVVRPRCLEYNPLMRPWYEMASSPVPRDVVLLINFDSSLHKRYKDSAREADLTLQVAFEIINSLTQYDRIIVMDTKHQIQQKKTIDRHVDLGVWLVGTIRNRNKLIKLLKGIFLELKSIPSGSLSNQKFSKQTDKIFETQNELNVSRRAETVVAQIVTTETISCLNSSLWESDAISEPTIITYAIGSSKMVSNCVNLSKEHHVVRINEYEDLRRNTNRFNQFFQWSKYLKNSSFKLDPVNDVRVTFPYESYYKRGPSLSITLPLIINDTFIGVVACGFNKLLNLEYSTLFEGFQDSYGFLIDAGGRTLSHPLLPSFHCYIKEGGEIVCKDPTYELVNRLEQNKNIQSVLQSMVDMENGSKIVESDLVLSTGHALDEVQGNPVTVVKRKLAYAWVPLTAVNLSLCIVIPLHNDKIYNVTYKCADEKKCKNIRFSYHLDEKEKGAEKCSYFGADVVRDQDLIKLAPSMFKNPVNYMRRTDPIIDAKQKGQDVFSVLRVPNINDSIALAETVSSMWKRGSSLQCYMGIRYFGSVDGVFISYPGMTLNSTYDHRKRPWYQVAATNRKPYPTVFLTVPYKDFFSGGYLMSVAVPLEKELSPGWSFLAGIMAGDFSVKFLTHNLRKRLPECNSEEVECFLIDNMGYTVLNLKKENMNRLHITQTYPNIAKDLVEKGLLKRDGCHDYEKDAIFMYWTFGLPYEETNIFTTIGNISIVIYEIPYMNIYLFGKMGDDGGAAPVNEKSRTVSDECATTCSNVPEAPCRLNFNTKCDEPEKDMRRRFGSLPACFPSESSPTNNDALKHCERLNSNTCFTSMNIKECELWEPTCI